MKFTRLYAASAALILFAAVAVFLRWHTANDFGYLQINTVPAAPLTQTSLFLDSAKLDPIRQGTVLLREKVGNISLQAAGYGNLMPLCAIEVKRDRITMVTVSILDRPPRCQCRFAATDTQHLCTS